MGPLIGQRVFDLPAPDPVLLDEARRGPKTAAEHARLLAAIPALHRVEQRPPAQALDCPPRLTIAAFNAERLKFSAATRALLDGAGVQVALLSEVDVGMARSGNGHGLCDLGRRGEGYAYAVEFVELDLGDPQEKRAHAGERNRAGFHGNGILTGLPLADVHVIPLEEGGLWFPGRADAQHRIGRRMAVAARVERAPGSLWFASLHLESKTDPADRAAQIEALLRGLDRLAPEANCVVGGDFNTKALPFEEDERDLVLREPERWEPLFARLRSAGFEWESANLARPTQRTGPAGNPAPPFRKLDWLVTRGVGCENPRVVPALGRGGEPLSDHDLVAVDVIL
jgi:endonuclease/exonuclease/phosphatase family metal-dependent hydrolase